MSKRTRRVRAALAKVQPKPEPEVSNKTNALVVQPERPVLVQKDHIIQYPELYMEVFITEPTAEILMAEMFARARCRQAKSLDQADLVVFTGGPDVNPKHYGETAHKKTNFNEARDKRDMAFYIEALKARIPMFGVCRGSQFLHIMQGGKLYQDIDGHVGDHGMLDKTGLSGTNHIDRIPSTHHQAVIKNNRMRVLGSIYRSTERWLNAKESENGRLEDVEAYFYRENCILGVQGHPEYRGFARYTHFCLKLIEQYVGSNPDIVMLENGKYRVKRDVVLLDKQ